MKVKEWIRFCLTGLIWGATFLWIKVSLQEVGPFTLVIYRVLISTLFLGLYYLWQRNVQFDKSPLVPAARQIEGPIVAPQLHLTWLELASLGLLNSGVAFFFDLLTRPRRDFTVSIHIPICGCCSGNCFSWRASRMAVG